MLLFMNPVTYHGGVAMEPSLPGRPGTGFGAPRGCTGARFVSSLAGLPANSAGTRRPQRINSAAKESMAKHFPAQGRVCPQPADSQSG